MVIFKGMTDVNAVIFDFDGVIVDTEPLHYKAFQRILEPAGLGFSWDRYIETYMGFDDRDAFKEAFHSQGSPLTDRELSRLVNEKAEIFQDVIRDGVTSYPGVIKLVSSLRTCGMPLAICSGALLSDILPILKLLGISNCFDVIVTADDVIKSKPDPDCYRIAFQNLRKVRDDVPMTPDSTIAIEDTPAGIQSASEAGLKVIAVTNSYPGNCLSHADYIVDSLEQLDGFRIVRS